MRKQSQSPAMNEANNLFKQVGEKAATDYEMAQRAFHANRERLKSERLAREAKQTKRQPDRTP